MNGKVFSEETKDLIVKVGDEALKLPFYAEPFDGMAIGFLVNFVDEKLDKVVPDQFDEAINVSINAALMGNYEEASLNIATAINILIDIPYIEEEVEQEVLVAATNLILRLIKSWIEGKKAGV